MAQQHTGTKTTPPAKARREASPKRLSLREFLTSDWPETGKYELIDGEARISPTGISLHQLLMMKLSQFLEEKLEKRGYLVLIDSSVLFSAQNSCPEPDISVFADGEKIDATTWQRTEKPDLIVEILSPSTAKADYGDKKKLYAKAAVAEYWIVDPMTGALAVFVKPKKGEYEQLLGDPNGFVRSPLLKTLVRVSRVGNNFKFLEK